MRLRTVILAGLALAAAGLSWAAPVRVSVRSAKLKAKPQFYAASVGEVAFGDALEVLQASAGWYRVQAGGRSGWLHASAVEARGAKRASGRSVGSGAASADELALAGKGFSDAEKAYRQGNRSADFESVDRLEARRIDEAELLAFLKKGGLLPGRRGSKR